MHPLASPRPLQFFCGKRFLYFQKAHRMILALRPLTCRSNYRIGLYTSNKTITVPSGKLTYPWNIPIFPDKDHQKWVIFHCYVSLPECSLGYFWVLLFTLLPFTLRPREVTVLSLGWPHEMRSMLWFKDFQRKSQEKNRCISRSGTNI